MATEPTPSAERSTQQRVAALFEIRRQQQLQRQQSSAVTTSARTKSSIISSKMASPGDKFPMGPTASGLSPPENNKDIPSSSDARKERDARRQRLVERQRERAELAKQKKEAKQKLQENLKHSFAASSPASSIPASPISDRFVANQFANDGAETDEYDDMTIRLPNRRKPSNGSINSTTSSQADTAAQKTLHTLQQNRDLAKRRPSLESIAEKRELEQLQKVFIFFFPYSSFSSLSHLKN